ncbi:MAG: M20/M25/M40 family metallo-hydrolase [Clostridia bacterium]|nr:M20/M25/M40 family metallo-hydrolase [Clostridia bacterium]
MKENLKKLCNSTFVGSEQKAKTLAIKTLKPFVDEIKTDLTGSVFGFIKGKSDKTILLEAHIDEIGFTVTNVLENGFVRLSNVGGIDIRTLPANTVKIHAKSGDIIGVFTSTPPHLAKDKNDEFSSLDEIFVDTGRDVKDLIKIGDFATFNTQAVELQNGFISAKSIDDRSGCASLIEVAKNIKMQDTPKDNIIILLASGEELGNRGAKIGAFNKQIDEAIIIDVSFGFTPNCNKEKCGEVKKGAMIGVSPILDKQMREKLINLAQENNIPYQLEVMNGLTSTDADVVTITETGIKTALVSIPIKYMHTPIETVYLNDIKAVSDLITEYLK